MDVSWILQVNFECFLASLKMKEAPNIFSEMGMDKLVISPMFASHFSMKDHLITVELR